MQDTTLKVLDNQEKFVDNINFKGWVLTVMRNIFINNYHKIVRTQTVVDQGVDLYNLDVVNDSGFDSQDGAYQIQEITKAINGLNNELKVPFSMFLSGYKYNEIADKLDVPLGTVKSRIFFARQELQKVLKTDMKPKIIRVRNWDGVENREENPTILAVGRRYDKETTIWC